MKTKSTKLRILLFSFLFLTIAKFSTAQTYDCYIANDAPVNSTTYEFDVFLKNTSTTSFSFRTIQMAFYVNPSWLPAGAAPNITLIAGSSGLIYYTPGLIQFNASPSLSAISVAPNSAGTCGANTLFTPGLNVKIGRFSIVSNSGSMNCVPANISMIRPIAADPSPGGNVNVKMAVTKWTTTDCSVPTSTTINSSGTFTSIIGGTLLDEFNNMGPVITGPVSSMVSCANQGTVSFSVFTSGNAGQVSPVTYQWLENGLPISNGGSYSGANSSTMTITSPSLILHSKSYSCVVTQCGTRTSSAAVLSVSNSDDNNPCTFDACDPATGIVTHSNTASGSPGASDNNACTNDLCNGIGVTVSSPIVCNDNNVCTDDSCDPATGCVYTNDNTNVYNDNNACTSGDACIAGVGTSGNPVICNDNNLCTDDSCNPATGCVYTNDNTNAYDDNNACTSGDACINGVATSGATVVCNDNNVCTDDSCDPASGCVFTNDNTNVYSDNNACTSGDACIAGVGTSGSPVVCDDNNLCTDDSCNPSTGCVFTNDNTNLYDDSNACTSGDACINGVATSGGPVVCNDNNVCTDDSCDPATGCVYTNDDTNAYDDSNACTSGDVCIAGVGTSGSPVVCDDNNLCTDDSCNPATGCVYTNDNTNPYDDSNACTSGDACINGIATSGAAVVCNDNNQCTDDSCDPATGCVYTNDDTNVYDDSNACTSGDFCIAGIGVSGSAVVCDDNNLCTDDSCDPATGCVYTNDNTNTYDDSNACTSGDACIDGVATSGAAVVCNDNNVCTDDSCDPATGCVYTNDDTNAYDDSNACTSGDVCIAGVGTSGSPVVCDDNNLCTDDSCNPATGCVYTNNNTNPYDDSNACTSGDACINGVATSGAPVICNDNNQCTDDSCDPATGCVYTNDDTNTYDDSNACTTGDFCLAGVGISGSPVVCDDNNLCTDDSCNPSTGCVYTNDNTNPYDDSNACTFGDVCINGIATSGSPVVCNDNNVCTDDSCDPATGCVYTNDDTNAYDDSNACTSGDVCIAGVGTSGAPVVCNDNNVCTDDSCNPATGCVYTNDNTNTYDDSNACTSGDACVNGIATSGSPVVCNDNNVCTDDSCDPATGCVYTNDDTNAYDDRNACTSGDVCIAGVGTAGSPVVCNDNNACTDDSCNPATGCVYTNDNTNTYNDNNACTSGDFCLNGVGRSGSPVVCNDNNLCTDDSCNPSTGCVYTNDNTNVYNDNNACTVGDACINGAATSGAPANINDNNACTLDGCISTSGVFHNQVSVTDNDNCTIDACNTLTGVITNTNNAPIATATGGTIACYGDKTCVTVSATGGQSPYIGTGSICNISAGMSSYVVVDANGCQVISNTVSISQPSKLQIDSLRSKSAGCAANDGTSSVYVSGGTTPYSYLWTPGNKTTATATGLAAGSYSVKVTDANGCTVSGSVVVGTGGSVPLAPGAITGLGLICQGSCYTYSIQPVTGATSYQWTLPTGATGSSSGTSITVCYPSTSSGYLCVRALSPCGPSPYTCKTITRVTSRPNSPSVITGNIYVCSNTASVQTYCVLFDPNTTTYTWSISGSSTASLSILSGQGTNCITVNVPAGYNGNQQLKVYQSNCLGNSKSKSSYIRRTTTVPSQPGSISGSSSVCKSYYNRNYSVGSVSNTSYYTWTINNGATITSGQGNTNIYVDFRTATSSSITISVKAVNGCGSSTVRTKTVSVNLGCKVAADGTEIVSESNMQSLEAYPNPTSGKVKIAFNSLNSARYSLKVVDVIGQILVNQDVTAIEGRNEMDINLENVAKGLYFISLQQENGQSETLRVIVE